MSNPFAADNAPEPGAGGTDRPQPPAGYPAQPYAAPGQHAAPDRAPVFRPGVSSGGPSYPPGAPAQPGPGPDPATQVYPAADAAPAAPSYPAPGFRPAAPGYPAPTSGPAAPGYPAPTSGPAAPGYPAPTSGSAGSGYAAPTSGPAAPGYPAPGFDPVSAPGYAGTAPTFDPYAAQPAVPARRSRATLVLALVAAVFFIATAVLAPLYLVKSRDYDTKTKAQAGTISQQHTQLDGLKKQLQDKQNELDDANTKQKGTADQLTEVTQEKQALATCITAISAVSAAKTQAQLDKALDAADTACQNAEKYLN